MLRGKISFTTLILAALASALFAVLVYAPYVLGAYYISALEEIFFYVALSICWYLFSGSTRYIALGSAAFVGTGVYFTALYLNRMDRGYFPILPLIVVIALPAVISLALSLAIGSISLRLKGIYFAIATFGASGLIQGIFKRWQSNIGIPYIIRVPRQFRDPSLVYYSLLVTMIAILLLTVFLRRSKLGLALKMIGECEEAALHVGVNTSLFKILGFIISASLMSLMGGVYVLTFPSTNIDQAYHANYSFLPAIMVLLGGIGTAYGPIVGAVTFELLDRYLLRTFTGYSNLIYGAILLIIVLFMPNGIMGVVRKLKATKPIWRKKAIKAPKMPSSTYL